ncbi:MAG: Maf family protein [Bacteroidales bacterium]|nr:Maf family protein [Bacteroidales bacterium]
MILVSKSPRRKELLEKMGLRFSIRHIEVDEQIVTCLSEFSEVAKAIALNKAKAIPRTWLGEDRWFLTADTIVSIDGEILGKPASEQEALKMLGKLSGKKHEVYTAVCLRNMDYFDVFVDRALVTFDLLNDQEMTYYVNTFKPFDKAGSYGAQDWIGLSKLRRIEGSFYTVMGLPTHLLYQHLIKNKIII